MQPICRHYAIAQEWQLMDENYLEQAAALAQAQRDLAVDLAHAQVDGLGRETCEDCDAVIPAARRQALPSAIRCIACQTLFERAKK